ncbi:GHKL domain-containing protein [Dellaglioa sp. L3N]
MKEIIIVGVQFLILQIFNVIVFKRFLNQSKLIKLILLMPLLMVGNAIFSEISTTFSSLFFSAMLVEINLVIFKKRYLQILYPMLFLPCSLIVFLIVNDVFPKMVNDTNYTGLFHIFSFILGGIISMLIQNQIMQNFSDLISQKRLNRILLIGYIAILMVLIMTTFQAEFKRDSNINNSILEAFFIAVLLLVILILIIYFLREVQKNRNENDKKQIEQLEKYTETLEHNYKELRKIKHNYINIITSSLLYIEEQDLVGLEKYYKEALKITNKSFKYDELRINDLQNIDSSALKGILAYKLIAAYQRALKIHFECLEPIHIKHISSVKIVEIIGILMDNAMEYIEKNDGKIDVLVTTEEAYESILIRNSLRSDNQINIDCIFRSGYTTKENHDGIGLNTLREIVSEEDNIEVLSTVDYGFFSQEVIISKIY